MDIHRLHHKASEAVIAALGAELQGVNLRGLDLLWPAAPLWPRHAPLLFPVVGMLPGDTLQHQGANHPMPKHGFARDAAFTWLERAATTCTLTLTDGPASRVHYPFPFRLTVAYTLSDGGLRMEVGLHNPGSVPLPASLGLHPAFRWPLVPGIPKHAHRLIFDREEPDPIHRLDAQGLLAPEPHPSPVSGAILPLQESLFAEDALIFLQPRSRSLRFEAEGGPALQLAWEGFPNLGVWTKPATEASFLCIEPWEGYASPVGWDGEFTQKPGGFLLAPGATRRWSLSLST